MKITVNHIEYELKPKTMRVARQIQEVEKSANIIEAYENEFKLIILALGDEATRECFDTTDINSVDLTLMVQVYNKIIAEYDRPEIEASKRDMDELLNSDSLAKIEKLAKQASVLAGLNEKLRK